jgi:ADP-heptose:LPS heptosyltransferase
MNIHTDCRHYRGNVPCSFHKRTGRSCGDCDQYAPADERILIVKLDGMGDVLRTTACLEPLKRQHPRSHVTWITRTEAVPLLAGNPHVDRILAVESNYLEFVHADEFDLALGPDADSLSSTIMLIAHAREKRGFISDRRGGVVPLNAAAESWWRMGIKDDLKRKNRRTYGEWLYDICELQPPIARPWFRPSDAALRAAERFFDGMPPGGGGRVCFNTGVGPRWEEKRWKQRHYAELARLMHERWPDTVIALVGGPREKEFNAALLASNAGFTDAGTNNSIDDFAALIASCDWFLTSDSLGYHVACAVGTPTVCLVGPTSPWELDCYGTNRVLHAGLECIACYLAKCPFETTCMDALTADDVWLGIDGAAAHAAASSTLAEPTGTAKRLAVRARPRVPLRPTGDPHAAARDLAG